MNKIIMHLDMDAFFASVEQAANPIYKGKPLIVGSRGRKYRTVVAACSYEAKAYGIQSGTSTAAALRLCPGANFVAADSAKYLYTSDAISQMLKKYSPRMERASIDEFYLDTSQAGLAGSVNIACEIKKMIGKAFSITGSIGIAPAKIIAKMAAKAKKPDGLLVLEEKDVASFLHELPVEKVPGIGPHMKEYLNALSIITCGQLADADPAMLSNRFGKIGQWFWQISHGLDSEEVAYWDAPDESPKSISHSHTVERPIRCPEELQSWIRMLSEMVAYRLRREGVESCILCLYLKGDDNVLSREKKFYSPTADPCQLYRRALCILESFHLERLSVRGLGVCATGLVPRDGWYLLSCEQKRQEMLAAVDRINERFGEWSIFPAAIQQIKN